MRKYIDLIEYKIIFPVSKLISGWESEYAAAMLHIEQIMTANSLQPNIEYSRIPSVYVSVENGMAEILFNMHTEPKE